MFGESPLAISLSFENTKYLSIKERMGTLLQNREEALAAHELARNHMIKWQKSTFGKVWLDSWNLKTVYH